ncbi:MAG TPA: hypothetical protein VFC19_13300 [Candidatus Limnocylindrales bacterium]|nr:hypothetical protein [Candidatus Limnocylindrales bacterium]
MGRWISGGGMIATPRGPAGTFLGIGLILMAIGLHLITQPRRAPEVSRAWSTLGQSMA